MQLTPKGTRTLILARNGGSASLAPILATLNPDVIAARDTAVSSASAASTSASNAATSATAAATAKTAAETAATAAQAVGTTNDTIIASRVNDPTSATRTALAGTFVPKWKPSTAYTAGDIVTAPDGTIVKRTTTGTSGATYTGTNWTVVAADETTGLGAALVAKYPRRSEIPVNVSILDLPTSNCWTAHSGSKRTGLPIAPEQSMSAYRLAYALGAPILDIDYRQTRDGVLIGIHDPDTSAVSDINVTVASTGYAYMPQIHHPLDVGDGWAGEDFSLLTDLLNEFGGKVVMTVEAKGGVPDVAPLAALIKARGLVNSVFINSGDSTVLAAIVAAGCHAHGFGAYTNAHIDAQAAAIGADIGMGLVELPIDASAALVTYAIGKGFGRIVAGPINTSGTPTSITKFSQLAAMDSRMNGFVNDAVGYLGRTGGEASRSADNLAGPVRTGKRPPGMRIVNAPGGVWWTKGNGAELRSLSPAGGRSLVAGNVSGTPTTSGSLTLKFKMPTLPTSTSEAFRGRVLMPDEAPANVAADASSQGYTISLRANGQLNLWSQPVGGGSGVAQGGTPTGPALVAGTEYGMRLDWTATQIRLVRTDAVATLSGAVSAGTVTSLAVNALPAAIASGTKLVLTDGTEVTTSALASAGATSISIASATVPAMASGAGLLMTTGYVNNTDWRGKYHGAYTSMTTGQAYLTDIVLA